MTTALPTEYAARKKLPLWDYFFGYFPLAFLEEVKVAVEGNKQHLNGDNKIRWDRNKSTDQLNTAFRHLFDYGTGTRKDTDGTYHLAKAIWRLRAQLQLDIEEERAAEARQEEARGHDEPAPRLEDDPEGFLT